jgi:uncharacterized phage protein (TIGR02218 family)
VKTISPALRSHLAQTVTTLATCWRVIRTDHQEFAYTSFDEDLVVDGVTYSSLAGFTRSAVQTGSTGEVDNLELVGFFQPDAITEQDLKNGLFDYADVYIFVVNWANLGQGVCRLRRGWLGECTRSPAGVFHAELRGLTQALVQEFGDQFMPLCRADLGDSKCKVPIAPFLWKANTGVSKGAYAQALTQDTDPLKTAIFQATNAGVTGATEPVWNTTIEASTGDNTIEWVSKPYWRGLGTVIEQVNARQFICTPLSVPALDMDAASAMSKTASISFRDNVSAGTSIAVSDGVTTHTFLTTEDGSAEQGIEFAAAFFLSFNGTWGISTTLDPGTFSLNFQNDSGPQGNITKTGDALRGVVVRNFETIPFAGGAVTFISGANAGRSIEMKLYDAATATVTLWLGAYFPIEPEDRFRYYPGCDKRRDTCFYTFDNILNFRGEPDMPTVDRLLAYPDAG